MARIAKSLDVLRAQIDAKYPNRSKLSDGWIGDTAHRARPSDHNPNAAGVVTALDITHDPAHGVDTWALAEILRANKDPRIKYVISNGRIFSSVVSPWQWRPYTGANKHAHHIHVSVMGDAALYELATPWTLEPLRQAAPAALPAPVLPRGITADMRRRMAKAIIDFEARRVDGKLAVYYPPANDGGGAYEVAGINVRYHPAEAAKLKALIEAGRHEQAEAAVIDYLLSYTKPAAGWTTDAGVEFYLRDCVFNRGPKGAARILQRALEVEDDGEVGPTTRAAMEKVSPDALLGDLRKAREEYEREVVGYRANFWRGLVNRWDKALTAARSFQKEQGSLPAVVKRTIETGVGGSAVAYTFWEWIVANPVPAAFIAAGVVLVGFLAVRQLRAWREALPAAPVAPAPSVIKDG
jgi:lysozyme family protein